MPELPEVETVRRAIRPHLVGRRIEDAVVRQHSFRLPAPKNLRRLIVGKHVGETRRRGKYLIVELAEGGALIIHLGMSGSLFFSPSPPREKHEHIGARVGGRFLIYKDPRRFGCFVHCAGAPDLHPLLRGLGPEPLSAAFSGAALFRLLQNRKTPIKTALMNSRLIAGVGNIYASESLHLAGVAPQTLAGDIDSERARRLAAAIKKTLRKAIAAGGSTIRDFANADGAPGYFQMQWRVYGRDGERCGCGGVVQKIRQNGRATYYCPECQC